MIEARVALFTKWFVVWKSTLVHEDKSHKFVEIEALLFGHSMSCHWIFSYLRRIHSIVPRGTDHQGQSSNLFPIKHRARQQICFN